MRACLGVGRALAEGVHVTAAAKPKNKKTHGGFHHGRRSVLYQPLTSEAVAKPPSMPPASGTPMATACGFFFWAAGGRWRRRRRFSAFAYMQVAPCANPAQQRRRRENNPTLQARAGGERLSHQCEHLDHLALL